VGEQQATQLLLDAGITQVEIKYQPAGMPSSYYFATKD
jgi:hypothetical protein